MPSDSGLPTLFLSYAHGDHAPAQRLARALERAGYTVWWDALIEGGTRFASSINEALETADAVLVLATDREICRRPAVAARYTRALQRNGSPPDCLRWSG
jgi:TIR domain